MKTLLIIFITVVLWLFTIQAYPYTWEPEVVWEIESEFELNPFVVFVVSEHFRFQLRPDVPIFQRVLAYERLIHYNVSSGSVTAAPEPTTFVLLASGLVGLWGVRRRR